MSGRGTGGYGRGGYPRENNIAYPVFLPTAQQYGRAPGPGPMIPTGQGQVRGPNTNQQQNQQRRPQRPPKSESTPPPPPQQQQGGGGGGNSNEVLKVAGKSNAKALAGAVAKRMRDGGSVKAVALGAASVNQAVKSLAIARTFLEEDGVDLAVRPEFIHIPGKDANEPQRSALRFNIIPRPPQNQGRSKPKGPEGNQSELKVAGKTSPMSAAGAIAKRVREGKKCVVVAMGAESVNQAVKSIAIARTYLEDDMLDINFKPRFVHVEMDNAQGASSIRDIDATETKSAVEMTILINQL